MTLRYVVEHTPNADRVGSLGDALRFRISNGANVADVLAAIVDALPQDAQYRIAQALGVPFAELYPQAVSGDKARQKELDRLRAAYGGDGCG